MKFIADGMLGKLARWLRMIGQDVFYSVNLDDAQLLNFAKVESRILLTKDFALYKRAIATEVAVFFVQGKTKSVQLAEMAKRFALTLAIDMSKSRCPLCNDQLNFVPKEVLKDTLEKNTFIYYNQFWQCSNCGQIYWQGAHWNQIVETISKSQEEFIEIKEKGFKQAI